MDFIKESGLWEYLKTVGRPIYLYGMGDGALKIMEVCRRFDIPIDGIYASDGFVRGHSFCGYRVEKLSDVRAKYNDDFISLLAFGTELEPLKSYLFSLSEQLEFYAPDVPVCKTDDRVFDLSYLEEYKTELEKSYSLLADEQSRRVFEDTINFKLSGRLSYLKACETDKSEIFTSIIKPSGDEHYVDLGGYNGDTVIEFVKAAGGARKITVFEPDKKNFEKLKKNLTEAGINADCYNLGAWDKEEILRLSGGKGGRNSKLDKVGKLEVSVNSVDNIVKTPPTVIKFDIEGAESRAIEGCAQAIRRYKPKLMAAAYHRNEDLFAIILQVMRLNPEYKAYLRHNPYIPAWETNYIFI